MLSLFVITSTKVASASSFDYYFHLLKGQLSIWNKIRPLDEVSFLPYEQTYINELKLALKFGEQEGLKVGGSYGKFARIDRDAVSYIVVHAPVDDLQAIMFDFPILGKVPYKGFFVQEEALKLAKTFKDQGYDVYLGRVRAYSMLGIMDDPLISSMLAGPVEDFIDTIFHELTHKTLWIKNNADFNENFANFVAMKLSRKYFKGEALKKYEKILQEEIDYGKNLNLLKEKLKTLYKDKNKLSKEELLSKKTKIFEEAKKWNGPQNNAQVYINNIYGRGSECLEALWKQYQEKLLPLLEDKEGIERCASKSN